MAVVPTRRVYWKDKFDGRAVDINADSFDPAVHADEPWTRPAPKAAPVEKTVPAKPSKRGRG